MPNLITSNRTYASYKNAELALNNAVIRTGKDLKDVRYLIAVSPETGRFVPTLVGIEYVHFAHMGIMVVS
jgi:hypothetical protein